MAPNEDSMPPNSEEPVKERHGLGAAGVITPD